MSDIAAMMLGFWIARRASVRVSLGLVIVMEVVVLVIRDNLTLNILMLIHPFEAIKRWQLGGQSSTRRRCEVVSRVSRRWRCSVSAHRRQHDAVSDRAETAT